MSGGRRGVVVTGMGLVTPLGLGVKENWAGVKEYRTGISGNAKGELPAFLEFMGRVPELSVESHVPPGLLGQLKFLNRGSVLGFAASREAVRGSGIDLGVTEPGRRALYVASGDTTKVGCDFMYPAMKEATKSAWRDIDFERLNRATLDRVNPIFLLESILNNLFSFLSASFEFMGTNTTLASHSPCGANALELAYRSIRHGYADVAIAVGCGNWITEIPLYELEGLGVLSQCREGARSYRPFDKGRDGFIAGEGGAALFLESEDLATRRGSAVLARIRGTGNSAEPPGGSGLGVPGEVTRRCMSAALQDGGCTLSDLSFICPHGSGSQKGDRSELSAVGGLLGGMVREVPLTGLKPYTGHLGAASDIAEIILGIEATREQTVPATLNFRESEPQFREFSISGSHQPCKGDTFLSVSYGIGGQSSSVVIQVL
jgi:3-oxoacyl-[acyl-carrier-protein] synthase II